MTKEKYKGVLFLDMDGVLCTPRMWLVKGPGTINYLDPVCVQLLDKFCQDNQLSLVCSSSWRVSRRVPDILHSHGMLTGFVSRGLMEVDDREYEICNTPRHSPLKGEDTTRGAEIIHWLNDNYHLMENPNRFIILDDEINDIASHDKLKDHVVKCDTYNGITWEVFKQAQNIMSIVNNKCSKYHE